MRAENPLTSRDEREEPQPPSLVQWLRPPSPATPGRGPGVRPHRANTVARHLSRGWATGDAAWPRARSHERLVDRVTQLYADVARVPAG